MSLEERTNLNILKKYYDISLSIVKNILGEEEVDYLMDGKEVFLDVNYEKTGWFGLCDDNGFFCKIQVNSDLFYMKKKLLIETLIHEIIHTFKNTHGHDANWMIYADMITVSTPYNIRFYMDLDEDEFRDKYLI